MVKIEINDKNKQAVVIHWTDDKSSNPIKFNGRLDMVIGTLIMFLEDYRDDYFSSARQEDMP